MPLHQELMRFDIKCCISRKKSGTRIQIFDDNYYSCSFEMTMQKIQNIHFDVDFSMVKSEDIFSTQIQTLLT